MICQLIQETLSALIQNDAFHILHLKNFQPHFLSALTRANSPGTKFLGETFENRNMLGNRNGQSLFASNSYSQGQRHFRKQIKQKSIIILKMRRLSIQTIKIFSPGMSDLVIFLKYDINSI